MNNLKRLEQVKKLNKIIKQSAKKLSEGDLIKLITLSARAEVQTVNNISGRIEITDREIKDAIKKYGKANSRRK